ncbi:MAG: hypothetical protein ACTSRP_03265 [Candidatus Helarchaeota archaeon]
MSTQKKELENMNVDELIALYKKNKRIIRENLEKRENISQELYNHENNIRLIKNRKQSIKNG